MPEGTEPFTNLEIDPSLLPKLGEVTYHPLEKRFVYILIIETLLGWGIIQGGLWFTFFLVDSPSKLLSLFVALAIGLCLLLALNLSWLKKAYQKRGFAIRENDISYKKGIVISKEITIPYKKIQQVSVTQNIIFKLANLYTLQLHSAAQDAGNLQLSGLTREQAENLKSLILQHIH